VKYFTKPANDKESLTGVKKEEVTIWYKIELMQPITTARY
jgi:hypothetical protein